MDDAPPKASGDAGAPAWVMTFADLMSLLMCFFVLLLSFSEMDVLKFKQLAGSMKEAFGVQRQIKAKEIPKGTSIIAKEFSPGKPEPTIVNDIRQRTTEELKRQLKIQDSEVDAADAVGNVTTTGSDEQPIERIVEVPVIPEADASELKDALKAELAEGLVDVETDRQRIIIRIQEKGAFPSGTATLMKKFEPVIGRIGDVLTRTDGRIVVAGHTDDIPISTARFRSNWELAAARSVTVVHHLAKVTGLAHERFLIEGYADTAPLAPNDSPANRARNRRVEIVIIKEDDATEEGDQPTEAAPAGSESAGPSDVVLPPATEQPHENTRAGRA